MSKGSGLDFPRTEEGLQAALHRLAEARSAQDATTEGEVLLHLSFLVKWVRSDNGQPPFERSESLALEALDIFRQTGDRSGQIRALIRAISPFKPDVVAKRLQEADAIAQALGDPLLLADVKAARSRNLGLRDREQAKQCALEALELYRQLDHARGMAGCLFSLSIGLGKSPDKIAYALEAFELYRKAGENEEAGRALTLAVVNSDTDEELIALEPSFQLALADALESGNRRSEQLCYSNLAKISAAKGDSEAAIRFARWQSELDQADGRTDLERWEESMDMTKMLLAYAKAQGDQEGLKAFKDELARLKREKPKA